MSRSYTEYCKVIVNQKTNDSLLQEIIQGGATFGAPFRVTCVCLEFTFEFKKLYHRTL